MRVGFLGCGNMGGALATAVSRRKGNKIYLCDLVENKAAALKDKIGGDTEICDIEAIKECEVLFLGVKPNGAREALISLGDGYRGLIISMVAGMQTEAIAEVTRSARVIRIMPNTPASVGEGMILYSIGAGATKEDGEALCALLSEAGELCELDEELIDKATAISGCGFIYTSISSMPVFGSSTFAAIRSSSSTALL